MSRTTLKLNTWKTTYSKVSHNSNAWSTICTNFYNVVDSNGFNVSNQCITYVINIFLLPNYVNESYEYIAIWTSKMLYNGHHVMLSQPLEQMVVPYFWIEFCIFSVICLATSTLDILTNLCVIHDMMGVCSRFETQRLLS
jgi:uncharacterized protein (UPF0297 family)